MSTTCVTLGHLDIQNRMAPFPTSMTLWLLFEYRFCGMFSLSVFQIFIASLMFFFLHNRVLSFELDLRLNCVKIQESCSQNEAIDLQNEKKKKIVPCIVSSLFTGDMFQWVNFHRVEVDFLHIYLFFWFCRWISASIKPWLTPTDGSLPNLLNTFYT